MLVVNSIKALLSFAAATFRAASIRTKDRYSAIGVLHAIGLQLAQQGVATACAKLLGNRPGHAGSVYVKAS